MTRDETRDDASNRMRNVSHTNPYTGETFTTVYERGPAVTDGGQSDSKPATTGGLEAMKNVDHTPPHGDETNRVWNRGRTAITGRNRSVAGDVDE
ncbi:hypothetical protein ELS19_06720 [Halogeometricum borinquense]|uniref:Uncharacterized protein n=1 Tax=Halogeometricum borinquense TaxID=60847 RepID=A0A482TBR1_9EURY|nr:hypothetical protein [Halogeometricum borinquense]RYJ13686.1 hypothetical protein ELS19_06720 [Halogeometricum borinquense]